MPGYIDVNLLKERMYHEAFEKTTDMQRWDSGCWIRYKMFENVVKDIPIADVVEVVRCKDCKHYENGFCYNPNTYDDEKTRGNTIPGWFCADGERMNDGEIH